MKSWGDCGRAKNFPGINPARHQVVPSAFRRAACEHRGFDLDKTKVVEVTAGQLGDFMPREKILKELRAAQVEIPVPQAYVLACFNFVFHLKRRRLRAVE